MNKTEKIKEIHRKIVPQISISQIINIKEIAIHQAFQI